MIATDSFLLLSTPLVAATEHVPFDPRCLGASAFRGGEERFEVDHWREGDIARAAELLHASYPLEIGRHFAPRGTPAEWLRYVTALATQGPCGVFHPQSTRVVRDRDAMRGLALMTRVAPATAHLAQLAVRPDSRRWGLATRLVQEAAALSHAAGCRELTLLVAAANESARRLYESLGFIEKSG